MNQTSVLLMAQLAVYYLKRLHLGQEKSTILYLIDYIMPYPEGGAGICGIREANYLAKKRYNVVVIVSQRPIDQKTVLDKKTFNNSIKVISIQDIDLLDNIDIIIANHISYAHFAAIQKKKHSCLLIFRKHIDYSKKVSCADKLNISTSNLFECHKRFSEVDSLKLEEELTVHSDYIFDVDEENGSDIKVIHVPPLIIKNRQCYSARKLNTILIGGRLKDPIKGIKTIKTIIANLTKQNSNFELTCLGSLDRRYHDYFKELLDERFIYHDWTDFKKLKQHFLNNSIFLTSPVYEPYGMMLVESILNGCVPISTFEGVYKKICPEIELLEPLRSRKMKNEYALSQIIARLLLSEENIKSIASLFSKDLTKYIAKTKFIDKSLKDILQ
ncbi:MAG: glycosyltransferase [Cyclobacteriaceae bacterium]